MKLTDGREQSIRVHGGRDGRISYSKTPHESGGTVRVYRNGSTKTYDAVIPGVESMWSDKVEVLSVAKSKEILEREAERERLERERFEALTERVLAKAKKGGYRDDEDEPEPTEATAW